MRILHLISSGGMYGAEAVILNLCREIDSIGDCSSAIGVFFNSARPDTQLYDIAQEYQVESHLISCRGQLDFSVPSSIRKLVAETGADLIHAHGYKADVYTFFATRQNPIPHVSTCHNWLDNNLTLRLYGALDRYILRSFDTVIAVSEQVQNRLLTAGLPRAKVHLIRNGVDLRLFARSEKRAANDQQVTIGCAARLSTEKGIDLLIQAVADVFQDIPAATLLIAGDGPDRDALEDDIRNRAMSSRVKLLGHLTDMRAFYASLDILVLPSRTEGLPVALLEGMAKGLPVIATSVGAIPQVIEAGHTGLLVPPEDPGALGDAITSLARDPQLRSRLGQAAHELIRREYSAERMTSEYLNLYEAALQGRECSVRKSSAT